MDRHVPRFFALVIGIDSYPGLRDEVHLEGACNDARNIHEWLSQDVLAGTDNRNIILLLDKEATREAIIKKITALSNNDKIQPGDPILIYYAGHGSVAMKHPNWQYTGMRGRGESSTQSLIEVLLPHDVYTPHWAPQEQQVQPIPDTTINRLLRELAQKSDNITVIIDSSFLAGSTRDEDLNSEEAMGRARGIDLYKHFGHAPILPEDLDIDIMVRTMDLLFKGGDQASHVLLVASGDAENAYESRLGSEESQGRFTRAFLHELRDPSRGDISYSTLIEEFPPLIGWNGYPLRQHPHGVGANMDRILFNGTLPARDPSFIRIYSDLEPDSIPLNRDGPFTPLYAVDGTTYTLDIGDADWIVQGSKVAIYGTSFSFDEKILCTMTVTEIQSFSATLVPVGPKPAGLPRRIYAKQFGWTEHQQLRVHCTSALRNYLDGGILTASRPGYFDPETGLCFVDRKQDAVLVVDVEKGNMVSDYRFMAMLLRLPITTNPTHQELLPLLRRAVRWNWGLTRGIACPTEEVTLEFTSLRSIKTGFRAGELEPDGTNLNEAGVVRLKKGEYYGFTLTNHLKTDLHVKIFWFDSTLEIEPIYRGATGRRQETDPTLRGNGGIFPVGYGAPGVSSFTFEESSVGDTPLGFIRVFIQDRDDRIPPIEFPTLHSTQSPRLSNTSSHLSTRNTPAIVRDKPRRYTITLRVIVK